MDESKKEQQHSRRTPGEHRLVRQDMKNSRRKSFSWRNMKMMIEQLPTSVLRGRCLLCIALYCLLADVGLARTNTSRVL